jgi:predicted FMN-binding regulatory protein PaiB
LQGKWKLSQNRSAPDRVGAIADVKTAGAGELAARMERVDRAQPRSA